jgi:hypothetical protein
MDVRRVVIGNVREVPSRFAGHCRFGHWLTGRHSECGSGSDFSFALQFLSLLLNPVHPLFLFLVHAQIGVEPRELFGTFLCTSETNVCNR